MQCAAVRMKLCPRITVKTPRPRVLGNLTMALLTDLFALVRFGVIAIAPGPVKNGLYPALPRPSSRRSAAGGRRRAGGCGLSLPFESRSTLTPSRTARLSCIFGRCQILEELCCAAVKVGFVAAAPKLRTHFVGHVTVVADFAQGPKKSAVVDEAFSHGHSPDDIGFPSVVDER